MAEKENKGYTAAFIAAHFGHVEALRALKDLGCLVAAEKEKVQVGVQIMAGAGEAGTMVNLSWVEKR